jgi:hypothetical protein
METATGLTVLGTAIGSAKVVEKILGPTADYLGLGIRDWAQRRIENVGRIFENAQKKLGARLEEPGTVPPKVLKGILDEGSFCDDELAGEYFGGVLASSRSEVGRDDRGAAFIALIGRLSAYQIRSHFVFYRMIHMLYEGVDENIGTHQGRHRLRTLIPLSAYVAAMEFGERENVESILSHVMFGLSREYLVEQDFLYGSVEHLRSQSNYAAAEGPSILLSPSVLGVELYLWAHGRGDLYSREILNPAVHLISDVAVTLTPGFRSTEFPDRTFPKPVQAGSADGVVRLDE